MVGLQSAERLLKHLHRQIFVSTMRTNLGHEEDAVAPPFQRSTHPDFGFAAMIFPAVVEEIHARVDRAVHDSVRRRLILSVAKVMSAQAERGDLNICMAPKGTAGDGGLAGSLRHEVNL